MLRKITTLICGVYLCFNVEAQCNGSDYLCSKKYNEVAFLTTHNAYNSSNAGFTFPNQTNGLTQQLNDGVRALMLDVYDQNGAAVVYHGSVFFGSDPLSANLSEIKTFLDANQGEVITLILECYVDANTIEAELSNAGLLSMAYAKPLGQDWATLDEMIADNKRLVVLTDVDDAGVGQEWYHYVWDFAVETHYSVNSNNSFTNDYNRGDANNDLFIFNHFVTNATLGIGMENEANIVNAFDFLNDRIEGHFGEYGKFPNFITLDFYHHGNGKEVVDSLNSETYVSVDESISTKESIVVQPNPVFDIVTVDGLSSDQTYSIEVISLRGRIKREYDCASQDSFSLNLASLSSGIYILRISNADGIVYNHRVVVD